MPQRPQPLQIQVTVEESNYDDSVIDISRANDFSRASTPGLYRAGSGQYSPLPGSVTQEGSYRLSQISRTEMVLVPSSRITGGGDESDSGALYHISIEANVFFPLCTTTVVRRGDAAGEVVGEFTVGSYEASSVTMGRTKLDLKDVWNNKVNWGLMEKVVDWQFFGPYRLRWRRLDDVFVPEKGVRVQWECLLIEDGASKGDRIATFEPEILPNPILIGRRRTLPALRIKGDGAMVFDELMMSALLLQRARLKMLETKNSQLLY